MSNKKIPLRVKESVVRGVALQVFTLALISIFRHNFYTLFILLGDFFIRAFIHPQFSPLAWISKNLITKVIPFRKRLIIFRPKRFAAGIGFFLTAISIPLFFLYQSVPLIIILSILSFFSFLECFFSFCMGCKIFSLLIHLGLVQEDICTDCIYPGGEGI
ncbi:MAG: DUF4395 domain-containing protein [Spirochaetes bacterium]|nr:DUF4395 domain-containing protein [Spirochaetota bacterium]